LQLDAISLHHRQLLRQLDLQRDAMPEQLAPHANLLGRCITLTFARTPRFRYLRLRPAQARVASWERARPSPVRKFATAAGPTLSPFKFASLAELTGEMVRNSNAEALIRQTLLDSAGMALDAALFSNAGLSRYYASPPYRPGCLGPFRVVES